MRSLLSPTPKEIGTTELVDLYTFPTSRQWVRGIFVSSADGAVQGGGGTSGSLSTPGDHRIFALQRSLCDVILVGAGTARAERYQPVRESEVDVDLRRRLGLAPLPPIAVVSRSAALDPLLLDGADVATIVITTNQALVDERLDRAIVIRAGDQDVDVAAALDQLAGLGHQRVICEGGPTLLAQVAATDRLDDLCLTIAPTLVAGQRRRMLEGPALDPPSAMTLAHLLEEDGALFARYLTSR